MAEEKTEKESKKEPSKVEKAPQKAEVKKSGDKDVERVLTINLRRDLIGTPSWRKTEDAVRILRGTIEKKVKTKIVMDKRLNESIWSSGIKNPKMKWRVKIVKDGEVTRVELME
jgi:ribosomal protein L31E